MNYSSIVKLLTEHGIASASNDAAELISHFNGKPPSWCLANRDQNLPPEITKAAERLAAGTPLQYITGRAWFMGDKYFVSPDVLIPQPDTEHLAEAALKHLKPGMRLLDLCTGSGCIIISVLKRVIASGTGVELSAPALAVARRNAEIHKIGSRLELTQADALDSDIVTKLVSEADVIVSNPPYINADVIDTLSPQVRSEPRLALDGGRDGMRFYNRFITDYTRLMKLPCLSRLHRRGLFRHRPGRGRRLNQTGAARINYVIKIYFWSYSNMEKITLLILFGGKSTEYEVSLISASSIIENADREKYDIVTVGITKDGDWYLYEGGTAAIRDGSWCTDISKLSRAAISPSMSDRALLVMDGEKLRKIHVDVVFPVMHGAYSEDGTLQGVLQMSGIPFVGCGCETSAICMDKGTTKLVLKNFGIPQAHSIIVNAAAMRDNLDMIIAGCEKISAYPLFVKPANAGSSVGASKALYRDSLVKALENAAKYDSKIIVEEYIKGKECEVAVMGNTHFKVSTVGQIVPGSEFYDYSTKYSSESPATYNIPAEISPESAETIKKMAPRIAAILGVKGLSRVDFFVRKVGAREEVIFNEINTLPGFTEISMYPKLFMNDGMTYSEIIDRLVDLALGKEL